MAPDAGRIDHESAGRIPTDKANRRQWRGWAILGAKIALTLLILAVIVEQIDFRSVLGALSSISAAAAAAAFAILLVQSSIAALRLVMVVDLFGVRFRLLDSLRITLEGMFFSQTFLSFLGGDALRIWRVRRLGLTLPDATSAIALDRLIGILVNHLFLLASLPWLLARITAPSVRWALIALAVAGVAGFAFLLVLGSMRGRGGFLQPLAARIPLRGVTMVLIEASTVGRHFLAQFRQLVPVSLFSLLIAAANMAAFALILLGMGVHAPLALGCALLVPAVLEISMIPISIAGWGLREGAAVIAFGALGLPADQALGASLAYGVMVVGVSLLGGLIWLFETRQKQDARQKRIRTSRAR